MVNESGEHAVLATDRSNGAEAGQSLLQVQRLTVRFRTDDGILTAVDNVSFEIGRGETVGLVGESGCGKTVTSKSILRLLPHTSQFGEGSQILFDGIDLVTADETQMREVRGNRIAMVFQEPMTALNPVFRIGWQLDEALRLHTDLDRTGRRERALEMLKLVEMPNPELRLRQYPHELSGGMRQRVMIAIALCCEPELLIADEPTTALDVTIQAQILSLLSKLQQKLGMSVLLITHDLGVVAQVCDRVLVMYAGQIVEAASTIDLFHRPQHPYTRALIRSVPKAVRGDAAESSKSSASGRTAAPLNEPAANSASAANARTRRHLPTIPGRVPSLRELPPGCRFHNRCDIVQPRCETEAPPLTESPDGRCVRCFFPLESDGA